MVYFYACDEYPLQDFILIISKGSYLGFFGVFFYFRSLLYLFIFYIPENIKQISRHLVKQTCDTHDNYVTHMILWTMWCLLST